MAFAARIPPGRSGRMWLRRRVATAARGRDQLDRKLRILIPEQQRLRIQADLRQTAWVAACEEARTWLLRAALLGGQDAIRSAAAPQPAELEVVWTTAMGLRYPADAKLMGPADDVPSVASNAAIAPATAAFRDALLAGILAASADEAVRRVNEEIAVTRRRLRALEKRWLPSLQAALADLDLSLEQAEQEDGIRLRRAVPPSPIGGAYRDRTRATRRR
jgi:V/A-type H+/Na+-transporting ATPase subunit D